MRNDAAPTAARLCSPPDRLRAGLFGDLVDGDSARGRATRPRPERARARGSERVRRARLRRAEKKRVRGADCEPALSPVSRLEVRADCRAAARAVGGRAAEAKSTDGGRRHSEMCASVTRHPSWQRKRRYRCGPRDLGRRRTRGARDNLRVTALRAPHHIHVSNSPSARERSNRGEACSTRPACLVVFQPPGHQPAAPPPAHRLERVMAGCGCSDDARLTAFSRGCLDRLVVVRRCSRLTFDHAQSRTSGCGSAR